MKILVTVSSTSLFNDNSPGHFLDKKCQEEGIVVEENVNIRYNIPVIFGSQGPRVIIKGYFLSSIYMKPLNQMSSP